MSGLTIDSSALLGAVLTYTDPGGHGACGNTVGADGRGDYAVLFMGSSEVAETAAREYINSLQSRRVRNICLVTAEEGWLGCPITIIETSNNQVDAPEKAQEEAK